MSLKVIVTMMMNYSARRWVPHDLPLRRSDAATQRRSDAATQRRSDAATQRRVEMITVYRPVYRPVYGPVYRPVCRQASQPKPAEAHFSSREVTCGISSDHIMLLTLLRCVGFVLLYTVVLLTLLRCVGFVLFYTLVLLTLLRLVGFILCYTVVMLTLLQPSQVQLTEIYLDNGTSD